VGEIEVALVTAAGMSSAFVGIWLDAPSQNLGLATESCMLIMQHVFERRGLHRIELACPPGYDGVRRSLAKVHCRDEGVAVGYARSGDGWGDYVRFAMTASEWEEHRDELLAIAHEGRGADL